MENINPQKTDQSEMIPQQFICPLSRSIMLDPVLNRQGISFQRSFIQQWINLSHTDPISRRPIKIQDLKPNLALRDAIKNHLNRYNKLKNLSQELRKQILQKNKLIDVVNKQSFQLDNLSFNKPMIQGMIQNLRSENHFLRQKYQHQRQKYINQKNHTKILQARIKVLQNQNLKLRQKQIQKQRQRQRQNLKTN